MSRNTVVIGGTESDAHVVSIYLAELFLRERGYRVVNRSCQNTVEELLDVAGLEDDVLAIVVVNQNGQALDDLRNLKACKERLPGQVPVILGGHYWVGCERSEAYVERLRKHGVDHLLDAIEDLDATLRDVSRRFVEAGRTAVAA